MIIDLLPAEQGPQLAEHIGLIEHFGEWVLCSACRQAVAWCKQGVLEGKRISVNVSSVQVRCGHLVETVRQVPDETGLAPACLEMEITQINRLPENHKDGAIAEAIITLGRGLGLTVVAAGVEIAAQRQFLCNHACDQGQGWLFDRLMPAASFAEKYSSDDTLSNIYV